MCSELDAHNTYFISFKELTLFEIQWPEFNAAGKEMFLRSGVVSGVWLSTPIFMLYWTAVQFTPCNTFSDHLRIDTTQKQRTVRVLSGALYVQEANSISWIRQKWNQYPSHCIIYIQIQNALISHLQNMTQDLSLTVVVLSWLKIFYLRLSLDSKAQQLEHLPNFIYFNPAVPIELRQRVFSFSHFVENRAEL